MPDKQNSFECSTICWGVAAVVAVVLMLILWTLAGAGGFQAFLTGIVIGLLLGFGLNYFICGSQTPAGDLAAKEKPAQGTGPAAEDVNAEPAGGAAEVPTTAATATAEAESPVAEVAAPAVAATASTAASTSTTPTQFAGLKPSQPLAGEAELAQRKGSWKYEAPAQAAPEKAKAAPAKKTAEAKPAAKKAPAKKPAAAASSKAPAKAKRAPVAADGKPELFTAAPAEGADNLKLISGVGPKLEQTLNDLGIFTFSQVAGWRKKEIAWVDERLRFKGRIERDDWMSQAKILAKGGETEFSKRSKK